MSEPSGFLYRDDDPPHAWRHIRFVEQGGRDPRTDVNRWRFTLYYDAHLAITHFEYSEAAAQEFARRADVCFNTYEDFMAWKGPHSRGR